MSKRKGKTQADIDWENRTLCIDESCIGVVGSDGRCKECGKPYEGYQATSNESSETISTQQEDLQTDSSFEISSDDEWENRTLCIDESCIGVVGPDGRCKECGKPYKDSE